MEFSAIQIASFLNGTVEGNPDVKVSNFQNRRWQAGNIDILGKCQIRTLYLSYESKHRISK